MIARSTAVIGAYRIVLDTNVLLDWLVFRNPVCTSLEALLDAGRVEWLATQAMQDEMAHVLARGLRGDWSVDEAQWRGAWTRHARLVEAPAPSSSNPRCSDTDDQKFIDLALAVQADGLLTRDRAVLKLARRLRSGGIDVLTPERWNESMVAGRTQNP